MDGLTWGQLLDRLRGLDGNLDLYLDDEILVEDEKGQVIKVVEWTVERGMVLKGKSV